MNSQRGGGRGRDGRGNGRGGRARPRNGRGRGGRGRGSSRGRGEYKGRGLDPREQQLRSLTQKMNTYAEKRDVVMVESTFGEILQRGLDPSTVTMNVLLKAYARGGLMGKALYLLDNMESGAPEAFNVKVDEGSYNVIVNALSLTGDNHRAWEYIHRQRNAGFYTYKSVSSIIRNMSANDVEKNLEDTQIFERLHMNVDILNTLIRVLCVARPPKTARATCLFKEALRRGIKPDCRTYSILIQRFASDQDADLAKEYFNSAILEHGIQPDLILITASCIS